ncbi:MAG: electron transfer flavoprotein subunit alpha/FixB family protein, partial [Lachnospiraceae bacterium]
MANGICVFAENYNGKLEPVSAELITAAHLIQETTREQISVIVVAKDCDGIVKELANLGVDKIYVVKTDHDILLQDDAGSQAVAEILKKIEPTSVLIPATPTGRSLFSRVAVKLNCGLTADCTELLVGTKEDGSHFIKQNKPSFGENVVVTIITK